jgi:2-dehydropantoate 2-reductase
MRIAVFGTGGVGGYFGGRLAQAGEDVTFIARGGTLEALRTRGLRVDSIKGDFVLPSVKATDAPREEADVILVCVKAWQVPEAAAAMGPLIGRDTIAIPMENGLEAPEQLVAALGAGHAGGGLCGIVSFVVEPAHIRHAGAEPTVMFGELDNRASERLARLRDAFVRAGVQADIPPDIHRSMWTKFLFIAVMSGLGAVTRVPVGVWRTMPETRQLATDALREVLAIAAARGITLARDAVERTLDRFDGLPPESTASMQRDVLEGKPSELESQLGAVVRMARASGVPTPIFDTLYAALLPQERKTSRQQPVGSDQ